MKTKSYFEGFAAGTEAFRITAEGKDWFLGCNAALEQCTATFRGERPTTKKCPGPLARTGAEHAA
jgi:hypothetical protein